MHALIIEDEPLIVMAIEDALRDCGFTSFDVAASEQEAILVAGRTCPDLITADVKLRPGSGIDAVQSICSSVPIPVLFITGSAVEVRSRMPRQALVEKPFHAEQLIAEIKRALGSNDGAAAGQEPSKDGGK